MTLTPLISRKDIAQLLGVSTRSVVNNEKHWGLDKCRVNLNARFIRFRRRDAMQIFKRLRFL